MESNPREIDESYEVHFIDDFFENILPLATVDDLDCSKAGEE